MADEQLKKEGWELVRIELSKDKKTKSTYYTRPSDNHGLIVMEKLND
jgi:hypothetical protein